VRTSSTLTAELFEKHLLSRDEKVNIEFDSITIGDLIQTTDNSSAYTTPIIRSHSLTTPIDVTLVSSSGAKLVFMFRIIADRQIVETIKNEVEVQSEQRQKLSDVRDRIKTLLSLGTAVSEVSDNRFFVFCSKDASSLPVVTCLR